MIRSPAMIILIGVILISLGAPLIAPHDPLHAESGAELHPPSAEYPFGTDLLGRDVLSRLLFGGRQTLGMAGLALTFSVVPGLLIGLAAGYFGGWTDRLLSVLLNALLALPGLLLALTMIAVIGNGLVQIALAVGLAGLPPYARLVRTATRGVRVQSYVGAAQSLGANPLWIMRYHVLPNIAGSLLSFGAVTLSWAILNGAALAFLGFGGDPSAPDWGVMLADGRQVLRVAPWVSLAPGILITLTVFAVNRVAARLSR